MKCWVQEFSCTSLVLTRAMLLLAPLYRWRNWGSEWLNNSSTGTELGNCRDGMPKLSLTLNHLILPHMFSVDTSPNPLHWSYIGLLSSCTDTWRIFSWEGVVWHPRWTYHYLTAIGPFWLQGGDIYWHLLLTSGIQATSLGALHLCTLKLLCLWSFVHWLLSTEL